MRATWLATACLRCGWMTITFQRQIYKHCGMFINLGPELLFSFSFNLCYLTLAMPVYGCNDGQWCTKDVHKNCLSECEGPWNLFDRTVWSIKLKFYVPSQHNIGHFSLQRRSSKPISWLSTEKLIQMQQKQTCICNKI